MDTNSIYQKLAEEFVYIADKKDKEIKRDYTFRAQVTGVTDKGKYEVQYKGNTFSARCDIPLSSGAWVNVCAPQSNWSELYIQDGGIPVVKTMKVRLDDLYERINIAGGLNNKIVFGDTGWTSLQSENPDNGNMYRMQLQKDGTVTFYSSTDNGATWNTKTAVFNHRVLFNQILQAWDGKNSRDVLKVYDDGDTYNYGSEVILEGGGNMYVGSGESATNLYNTYGPNNGETTYLTSDNSVVLVSNCQTIANRKAAYLSTSALYPGANGAFTLGTSSLRWGQIYSTASSISTSDRSQKHDEMELDEEQATALIMGARPVTYKYNDGTSGRTHWGLIAQDVEAMLDALGIDTTDFAGFVKSPKEQVDERTGELSPVLDKDGNPIYEYGLRYEEFVAPLIKMNQRQERKIDELEERVQRLEKELVKIGGDSNICNNPSNRTI